MSVESWGEILLVVLALGMAVFIQLRVSKMRSSALGLIMPFLIFLISVCILFQDLQHIKEGIAESLTQIRAFLYFAVYNIPTILLLCIYNYCQRTRMTRYR